MPEKKRTYIACRCTLKLSNFIRGEKMFMRNLKYVWLIAVISMVLSACAPQPQAATQDDKAPITVWIDQVRQPMIDAFLKANPD